MSQLLAGAGVSRKRGWAFHRLGAMSIVVLLAAAPTQSQTAPPRPSAPRTKMDDGARELGTDQRLKGKSEWQRRDMIEFVVGNMLFVGFHELAHAVIHELGLPVLGREEDAADSFATIAMINLGTDFSNRVVIQAARGWFVMDRRDRKEGDKLEFYDEHGLDQQRAYQIVCLLVGWDQDRFKELADSVHMPQSRQDTCVGDYSNAEYSWNAELKPFRRAPDQPKSKIQIDYGPGTGKLEVYARSLRAIGYLETIAAYAAEIVVWPQLISIKLQSCGDANAQWNAQMRTEMLCYELAQDFFDLYLNYQDRTTERMTANELLARNIRRQRSLQSVSQQGLASQSGMDQNWLHRMENGRENPSVEQLEHLARALNVEMAELFKPEKEQATPAQATQAQTTRASQPHLKRSRK